MDEEDLYSELKPDIEAASAPLVEVSQMFIRKRGAFLPHAALLLGSGEVVPTMAVGPSEVTSSTEVLPLLHEALRRDERKHGIRALAVAEDVTVTPAGGHATRAIKILVEHRRGLTIAVYTPFRKRFLRGHEFQAPFAVLAKPEVCAWGTGDS
jgi:hypothetical protein